MKRFSQVIRVRLSEDGAASLRRIASSCGLSESAYVRHLIFNHLAVAETATNGHKRPQGSVPPQVPSLVLSPPLPPLAQDKNRPSPIPPRQIFAGAWLRITEREDRAMGEAYPWAERQAEYRKMEAWLEVNPERRPKKFSRFANNWLSKIPPPRNGNGAMPLKQPIPVEPSEDPRWEGFVSYYRIAYAEDLHGATPPWTDRDSLELNRLLERNPNATTGQLKDMFVHWWQSDGQVKSEFPHVWLPKLERWAASRIDRFGKAYE